MTDKIWQCCFTNTDHINGIAVSSGWTGLAISESMPHAAREACIRWQSGNSRIENESAASSNSVYEIICDNGYAFAMKHKYGLKDNHGRPNMFSHAYIVPMEEFLQDPNCLLALSDKNFADNQEEAEKINNEANLPASLIYDKAFEISSSLALLSMNKETYKTLLRTVYALNCDEKNLKPLHIEAYEDNEKMKALMYLIYIGLPYHVRVNLKMAIMPQTDTYFRSILFGQGAKERGTYIIPESGESNAKIQVSPVFELIDEFAEHYDLEEKDIYYKELSDKAVGLGGKGVLSERALKIAYAMNNIGDVKEKSEWNDEKLMLRLSDAFIYNADMISSLEYRKEFEDFVAAMLEEVMKRGIAINENMYGRVSDFSTRATSEVLKGTWKRCRQYQFETAMNEGQKKAWLAKLDTDEAESFTVFCTELINQKGDYAVLKEYLISAIEKSENISGLLKAEEKFISIEKGVSDKTLKEEVFNDIHKLLTDKLWELYKARINKTSELKGMYESACEVYELLSKLDETVDIKEAELKAKQYFWEAFNFEKLEMLGTEHELYSFMSLPEDDNYKLYISFIDKLNKIYKQEDLYESFKSLNSYCITNIEIVKTNEVKKRIKNIFERSLENKAPKNYTGGFIEDMAKAITDSDKKFIEDMVKIAIETDEKLVYENFIDIIKDISGEREQDYQSLERLIAQIEGTDRVLRNKIFESIYRKFKYTEEQKELTVRLDSWLALAKIKYPDIERFNIFDKEEDFEVDILFDEDRERLLEDSYYFSKCEDDEEKSEFLDGAKYYVKNKGSHKTVINKWVKYIEKREPSGGIIEDLLGKLKNPFAKKKEE